MVARPTTEMTQAAAKPPTAIIPILRERRSTDGIDGAGARVASSPRGIAGVATGASHACTEPSGTITTRVGIVFGCATGAVLYTDHFELIAYPRATASADRALDFDNRAGRPTVAAIAPGGYWLLDTREREWARYNSPELVQVAAVDDREGHVVALAADGRLLVFDAAGKQIATTASLGATGQLTVDATRAYVNAPGTIYEIDYADGARVAREFTIDASFVVETGR